jgi:hypothetical protein
MGCGNSQPKPTSSNADKTLLKEETEAKADKNSEKEVAKRRGYLEQFADQCRTATVADIEAGLSALTADDRAKLMRALDATTPKSLDEYVALAKTASPTELEDAFRGLSADMRKKVQEAIAPSHVQNTVVDESQPPANDNAELNPIAGKDVLNLNAIDTVEEVNVELAAGEADGVTRKTYCSCV